MSLNYSPADGEPIAYLHSQHATTSVTAAEPRPQFRSLSDWRHVIRHPFLSPESAASSTKGTYLDVRQFEGAESFRDVRSILESNPLIPVSLAGCGLDPKTRQKNLSDPYYRSGYSFLEGVRFKDLVEMIQHMKPEHRNQCTIVLANRPVHVYIDLDAGVDTAHPHKNAMYEKIKGREVEVQRELKRQFIRYFLRVIGREPDLSGMHWERASCPGKFSIHVHIVTEAFATIDDLKVFMKGFGNFICAEAGTMSESHLSISHADEHGQVVRVSLFDDSVYTKHRNFRLAGCCKPGKQALEWISDPMDCTSAAAMSLPDLIFRGLISYAINVDPANYLRMTEGSEMIKPTSRTGSHFKDSSAFRIADMSKSAIQSMLRGKDMLGGNAEVSSCFYKHYERGRSCIVGECSKGSAWCPILTRYAAEPIESYIHGSAVTNFTITSKSVKLWDWSCGRGASQTRVVLLKPDQRPLIHAMLRGKDASESDSSDMEIGDEDERESSLNHESPNRTNLTDRLPTSSCSPMVDIESDVGSSSSDSSSSLDSTPFARTRKRKAADSVCHFQRFDEMNLHLIDRNSIIDTRPERSTIQKIVAHWEGANRKRLKKCRDGHSRSAEKVGQLKAELIKDIVSYLNQYFKLSTRMPEPVVIVTLLEERRGRREWKNDFMNLKSFELSYNYLNVEINQKECRIAKLWMEHAECARFDKINFEPLPDGVVEERTKYVDFNLWKGFKIGASDGVRYLRDNGAHICATRLRPLLEHVMRVWCRGDSTLYAYTMNWMAWCIQRPNVKTGVGLVIRGDKGSGKGIVVQKLGKIYGPEYFTHAQRVEELVGEFNDHLQSCMLCFVDEVSFASDKKATNIVKTIISEKTITINTKFKSRFTMDSYTNLIFVGNDSKLIECEGNERRYFVLETDDKWSGSQTATSKEYFARIEAVPPEALRIMLSRRDISQFNPGTIPSSKAMRDQKERSLSIVHSWLNSCLVRGSILEVRDRPVVAAVSDSTSQHSSRVQDVQEAEEESHWKWPVAKSQIFEDFTRYCRQSDQSAVTQISFWKDLHAIFKSTEGVSLIKEHRRQGHEISVTLPNLQQSQELFRANVVHETGWSFDSQGESIKTKEAEYSEHDLGLHAFHEIDDKLAYCA